MDYALYNSVASRILSGPYVKVVDWNKDERKLMLVPVNIEQEFNCFKSQFDMAFNINGFKSIEEKIQVRHEINKALNYLGEKFNEIGFEYRIGEDGEEIRTFNWAKYVKYDFNSLTTDNGWDNLYRNTKPNSSGEYEMDDGHMFGSEYDVEAESMVKSSIKKLQELFEIFKGEIIKELSGVKNSPPPFEDNTKLQNELINNMQLLTELKRGLTEYGFFNLPKIKAIQDPQNIEKLVEYILKKQLPEKIAMLVYLEFPEFIVENTKTKQDMFQQMSKILGVPERAIKGNIYVLNSKSGEDKTRYTSHLHIENTKKFYKNLI